MLIENLKFAQYSLDLANNVHFLTFFRAKGTNSTM